MHYMTSLMNKVFAFFRRYVKLAKMIDHKTSFKSQFKSVLGSLLITILALAIPALVMVNMFIYAKHTILLSYLLLFLLMTGVLLYFVIYYKLLKNYHKEIEEINTKIPTYVEAALVSFIVFIIGLIAISIAL